MLKSRFPSNLMKGTLGLCLAVLLIAPAALLWSAADNPGRDRAPLGMKDNGSGNPPAWNEKEARFLRTQNRPRYARETDDVWSADKGPRRFKAPSFGERKSPNHLMLPNNWGSMDTRPGRGQHLGEELRADKGSAKHLIVQFKPEAIRGKGTKEIRKSLAGTGAQIVQYIPENGYLLRVNGKNRQKLLNDERFQFVDAYHPAYKVAPEVGRFPHYDPRKSGADELDLVIRSFKGVKKNQFVGRLNSLGTVTSVQEFNGKIIARVNARPDMVLKIARDVDVRYVHQKKDTRAMTLSTNIVTQIGRVLDPRYEGKFIQPFTDEEIDGGGQYVTAPGQIAGCTPYADGDDLDPNCYLIQPQFIGFVDNGFDLDSTPFAHSSTSPCVAPGADCSSLSTGVGVGANHRMVEMYVTSTDHNHDGTPEDGTGEGDFLSCSTIESGGRSHGHTVAATAAGNPSYGQFGLGFLYEDTDNSNQFFAFSNDENEVNVPLDGLARGARKLFIDATGNGVPVNGPPACATQFHSDIDAGAAIIDELETLVYRRDLNLANATVHPRGALVNVFAVGHPTDFDDNSFNGQGTYAGDAADIDEFLFEHRRVSVVVPVGNDGLIPDTSLKRDPYVPTDPNDGVGNDPLLDPEDIQVQDLATGKNIIAVGSNSTDTIQRQLSAQDGSAFINGFSSKGPSDAVSQRIAPMVVAPGFEGARGGGGREGEWGDDYFVSHTVVMSYDDEQDTVEGIEGVRVQDNSGTSFSAAKVGGAAAVIRDYFAKGYFPDGIRGTGPAITDVSGSLVKAVLAGSAQFKDQGLIANCANAFCIEEGYGAVELANILPVKSYPETIRPADQSNLAYVPDVPSRIAIVDEFGDHGLGWGVIELGGTIEYPFDMVHGGGSLRVALAWYDAPGVTLINNLDLEVQDGDYDRTPGWDYSAGDGSGACNSTAFGSFSSVCGECLISALPGDPNANAAYFDPTGNNPYVRRYLGNNLRFAQRFSQFAGCDVGTGALDPASPDSQRDTDNPTEVVHVYHSNGAYGVLGASQGSSSEGFFKAIVTYPDTGSQVGVPNTPCVVPASGLSLDTTVAAGNDVQLTTGDGVQYIASGVDDPGTPGVDEAQCDTTASGTDVQLVSSGVIGQPFAMVLTGPIVVAGATGKSQIALNQASYDCSETDLVITVTEEDTGYNDLSAQISAGTTVQVLDGVGAIVDEEKGIAFDFIVAPSAFRIWRTMAYTSEPRTVQYIGGLGRAPIRDNGLIEVEEGWTIKAVYTDPGDVLDTVQTVADVACADDITQAFVLLAVENAHNKFITGGCDLGRNINLRGDFNLDAGERVQYQVFANNHSGYAIRDLTATLTCVNPAGTTENPCQFINIIEPGGKINIGEIPLGREIAAVWNIDVDEAVTTLSTSSEKVVEFEITFEGTNTDMGSSVVSTFTYREALQADNERLFYDTDFPFGGREVLDFNQNGLIERAELGNAGRREEMEVRDYQSWSATTNAGLLTACGGASCIPFNFDANDGGFTARMSGDSKPGAGFPSGTQGWFYGTGGACGWQTQGSSGGGSAPKGVWHAGEGPIGTFGSGCGQYVVPSDPATVPQNEFVTHQLLSPVFNKVNTGTDARGFEFDVRMELVTWNANEEMADSESALYMSIDPDIDDDGPITLGDSYSYRQPFGIARTLLNQTQNARRFGPLFDPDGSITATATPTGDEVGVSLPLNVYDADNFLERPNMPTPATDADNNSGNGFTSDVSLSTGIGTGPCPTVPAGLSCRPGGFTQPQGPVRNRVVDTGASFEDFRGASGDRFQFEFMFLVTEGGAQATGFTVDDVRFQWSEQHPVDQPVFVGGDCSLQNVGGGFGITCDNPGTQTCIGGVRNGLFCLVDQDCALVALEGTCGGSVCTAGRVGLACSVDNDCDLGVCEGGNTELGCGIDADCNNATNDCGAIPFRLSPTVPGNSAVASQCAMINFSQAFLFDCTTALDVTVQDETPVLCGPATDVNNDGVADGCTVAPRQIMVNARSTSEGLGEPIALTETSPSSGVFKGSVSLSALQDQEGILFLDADPGENVNITVSYDDTSCDLDRDGVIAEAQFTDLDGDGVPNFGADGILADQDLVLTFVGGTPVSDDDNCYDSLAITDVFNPAGQASFDTDLDGDVDALDCVVNPLHNKNGQCDADSDGIGDICDNCPFTANNDQIDTDGDGVGNVCEVDDIDGDGVINNNDNCPTIYNPSQADAATPGGPGDDCDGVSPAACLGSAVAPDCDGDGIGELSDNCPNEGLDEFPNWVCAPSDWSCTYNPDQRDTDSDGIGDVCDAEDFDNDGVINPQDNCPLFYNPADPITQIQTDADGDGLGDDRSGEDTVGRCVGGPTPGSICLGIGTGSSCGVGGFCAQSSDGYCDPDGTDDNNNGVPDDLVQFNTEIACRYEEGSRGAPKTEIGSVNLAAVALFDDGTSDYVCTAGDPDPNNDPATIENCQSTLNSDCDDPGVPGSGVCTAVPDGLVDPGELISVQLDLANQTTDREGNAVPIVNASVGLSSGSPTVGCITKGQTFLGTLPAGSTVQTNATDLQFIISPVTGQSTLTKSAEARFTVNVNGDQIQGISPEPTFSVSLDSDQQVFGVIPSACGTPASGSALDPNHSAPGVLCEDFDTDRNSSGAFEWTALPLAASATDPLDFVRDTSDDVLGHAQDGGPVPLGVAGHQCAGDAAYAAAAIDCFPVPSERDWHLHSSQEGCDPVYEPGAAWSTRCDASEPKSHSGFRSMHMGRHLNNTDTLFDTYRFRQVSTFVLDPVNLGTGTELEFWHLMRVCDDKCVNAGADGTTAGGQVHISVLNTGTGNYERWERLEATNNGYHSFDNNVIVICEFDPGDDRLPPNDETMCAGSPGSPQWSDLGDIYGTDVTCTTDTDGSDPVDADCGSTTNRTVDPSCSWITDPTCGSFLENGQPGQRGVWAKSTFNLGAFSGRQARLRWIFQGGGGWGFGESRSWLEPQTGSPVFVYDQDDGWYVDDIKLTDLRTAPAIIVPDDRDGDSICPAQGDTDNCGVITVGIGGGVEVTPGNWTVTGAASGTGILLDARLTVAGDDPGTAGTVEGSCTSGILEYQWSDGAAQVIKAFSPAGEVVVTPLTDATYSVDVRCSSDPGCTATASVSASVYTGDGTDIVDFSGLSIDHDDVLNEATLSWTARPQIAGVSGFDVFRASISASTPLFPAAQFIGGVFDPDGAGPATSSCNVPNGGTGTIVSLTDVGMPVVGDAQLYMVGHSSNNGLAIAPLGRRPAGSDQPGTLVSSSVACP